MTPQLLHWGSWGRHQTLGVSGSNSFSWRLMVISRIFSKNRSIKKKRICRAENLRNSTKSKRWESWGRGRRRFLRVGGVVRRSGGLGLRRVRSPLLFSFSPSLFLPSFGSCLRSLSPLQYFLKSIFFPLSDFSSAKFGEWVREMDDFFSLWTATLPSLGSSP